MAKAIVRSIPANLSPTQLGILLGVSRQRADQLMQREKQSARDKVQKALQSHRLLKPSICSMCRQQSTRIEGHHSDYSKPLDVSWLCPPCHAQIHPHQCVNKDLLDIHRCRFCNKAISRAGRTSQWRNYYCQKHYKLWKYGTRICIRCGISFVPKRRPSPTFPATFCGNPCRLSPRL